MNNFVTRESAECPEGFALKAQGSEPPGISNKITELFFPNIFPLNLLNCEFKNSMHDPKPNIRKSKMYEFLRLFARYGNELYI